MKKVQAYLTVAVCGALILALFAFAVLKPQDDISRSERRKLKKFPTLTVQTVLSGRFMSDFEDYASDQFPMRDIFRAVKTAAAVTVFRQSDINGLYKTDGHIVKCEYPLNRDSVQSAADKFRRIYEKYLTDGENSVYCCVIPDKNYFFAESSGHLAMDYSAAVEIIKNCGFMEYIDIFPLLDGDDYYKTDPHWRQECITDAAEKIAREMGASLDTEYEAVTLDTPFYGAYSGQYAAKTNPDTMTYLTNDTIRGCTVYDYETDGRIAVYDLEKADGADMYEVFLSGPKSVQKIVNPMCETDKKLIIFRDSFGSSIAPLLISGYSEITLVDIRYISSGLIGKMVDFENAQVLFLYSTSVLNNSETLK